MDIRKKSLIILSGIIIVVILIFIVFSSTIFLDSYRNLESDHVRDNMDLILKNSNTEIANLNSTVGDWGPWDDTYMFVNGDNPSYIANNLIPATYDNLYLNFVAIVNNEGKIVYGQGYDLKNHELTPLRPDLVAELAKSDSPLKNTNISARVGGLLDLPGGMVLVASHPIVKSDYSGEPVGSIIMGRYIDAAEISRFSADFRHSISVIPVKETPRVSDEEDSLAGSGAEEPRNGSGAPIIFTHAIDRETVEGTTVLPDIYGNETILFSLQMPRDIYNQGGRTVLSSIFFQLVILFGLGILIIWLIDSQVLLRIATTNREIAQITEQKNPGGRVTVNGHDEISQLATSINTMLDQIDTSHAALSESEQRFRELAEQFPEIMVEVDTQGIPTFVNQAASSIFIFIYGGLKRPWSIFDLVAPEDRERFREDFSRILHGESMTGNEYVALKKDGTRFAVILYSTPIIKDSRITGVRIFAGDISERKRMEDELRKINEKMSLLSSITRHDIL
ncbi:MAG: CHASE4 domain-containing protein, partial [Methanoregula sp.]|nr:CHASE4 domain-containing protein [Methanoregula sp.]